MRSRQVVSHLLINRNFALLWSGQSISYLGDAIFSTTLILWIATRIAREQSWAPLAVSGVLIASAAATLLVGPLAGVFVDRWDRRRTLLTTNLVRAGLVAGLFPLTILPGGTLPIPWELGVIYGDVALITACDQFFSPARLALVGDIVVEGQRARATSAEQATQSLTGIIGPPLAAPILFGLGIQWAVLVDALSFGASFLAIAFMQAPSVDTVPGAAPGSPTAEFRAGLRFFAGNRVLMTILCALVVAMLGAGATNTLDIFFLQQNLHAPARYYGVLGAAFAAGAVVGALLLGALAHRIDLKRSFGLCLVLAGFLFLVYSRTSSFAAGVTMLALESVPNAGISVVFPALVLDVTPRELVGRVFAVLMPGLTLTSMVSMVLAGYLVSSPLHGFHADLLGAHVGPVDTIFSISGCLTMLAGLFALLTLRGPASSS